MRICLKFKSVFLLTSLRIIEAKRLFYYNFVIHIYFNIFIYHNMKTVHDISNDTSGYFQIININWFSTLFCTYICLVQFQLTVVLLKNP